MNDALRRIEPDGTLPPDAVQPLLAAIDSTDVETRHRVAFDPERYLGRFADLPAPAREAIVDAIATCDRRGTSSFAFGPLHALLLRGLWRLRNGAYRMTRKDTRIGRTFRGICDVLSYGARKGPAFAADVFYRQWHARRARRPAGIRLLDVLLLAAIQPFDFAAVYAEEIPQPPAARGYWNEPDRRKAVGRVLGLDFLATDGGCWYVESNVHPAIDYERSMIYDLVDPMCRNIVEFAKERGYRRLIVLDNTSEGIDPKMERDYVSEARRVGIELSLPTLPYVPGHAAVRGYGVPDDLQDDTFVVRIRPYPVSFDHVAGSKRTTYRALHAYQQQAVEPDLLLPVTSEEPPAIDAGDHGPYPNVVYKLPEIEQGRGVYFLKAKSAEHAREIVGPALRAPRRRTLEERVQYSVTGKEGVYQPFIPSRMIEDRRLYKVRALILVSPVGVKFLSAHRVIAPVPVPDKLDYGVVQDLRPYLLNTTAGGVIRQVPAEEEEQVARAAEAVGRGLAWAIERAFRVGPA